MPSHTRNDHGVRTQSVVVEPWLEHRLGVGRGVTDVRQRSARPGGGVWLSQPTPRCYHDQRQEQERLQHRCTPPSVSQIVPAGRICRQCIVGTIRRGQVPIVAGPARVLRQALGVAAIPGRTQRLDDMAALFLSLPWSFPSSLDEHQARCQRVRDRPPPPRQRRAARSGRRHPCSRTTRRTSPPRPTGCVLPLLADAGRSASGRRRPDVPHSSRV
jgi:hypothetical protein